MKRFSLVLCLVLIVSSCTKNKGNNPSSNNNSNCDTANVTYSGTVRAIISTNCSISGCHDAITAASGYDMSTYTGLDSAVQSGRIIGAIEHLMNYSPMPQNGTQLSQCEIEDIAAWIHHGALNN